MDPAVLPEGAVLRRWLNGVLHEVEVVPPDERGARYLYAGERCRTLTEVAARITGGWRQENGSKFFRLRRRRRTERAVYFIGK